MSEETTSTQRNSGCLGQGVVFAGWLIAAAAMGWAIAFTHCAASFIAVERLQGQIRDYFIVLVQGSYIVMIILGGLGLAWATRWALQRTNCRSLAVAVSMGAAAAALAVYSMCHASWLAGYVAWFLERRYANLEGAVLAGIFALLLGAIVWVSAMAGSAGTDPVGTFYLALLLGTAAYYLAIVLWTAIRTVRGQKRLATCRQASSEGT